MTKPENPKVVDLKLVDINDEVTEIVADILKDAQALHEDSPQSAISIMMIGRDGKLSMRTSCASRVELMGHLAALSHHIMADD